MQEGCHGLPVVLWPLLVMQRHARALLCGFSVASLANSREALRNVREILFFWCRLRYHDEIHYHDLTEEQGERLVAQIKLLDCFAKPPRVDFLYLGKR